MIAEVVLNFTVRCSPRHVALAGHRAMRPKDNVHATTYAIDSADKQAACRLSLQNRHIHVEVNKELTVSQIT